MSSSITIQSSWMRFWNVKDLNLTNAGLATTTKEENLWLTHGLLIPLNQALLHPIMKANILIKNLHNTKKTSEDQKDIKNLVPLFNTSSKKRHPKGRLKHPGIKIVSMVIAIDVMILVIGHWIADLMQEVLGLPTIWLDVGHVTVLAILLQIATP